MSKIKRIFFLGDCSTATGGANNHTNWDKHRQGITDISKLTVPSWMDIVAERLGIEVYAHGEAIGTREIIWQLDNLIDSGVKLLESDLIFCALGPPHRYSPRPWLPGINCGLTKDKWFRDPNYINSLFGDTWPDLPEESYRTVMRTVKTANNLFFTPEQNKLNINMTVRSLETYAQTYPAQFVAIISLEHTFNTYNELNYKFNRVKLLSKINNDFWKLDPSTGARSSYDICNNFTENNVHLYVDYIIKEFERLELI